MLGRRYPWGRGLLCVAKPCRKLPLPQARIECRSAEWLVRSLGKSSDDQMVMDGVRISPFLREKEARFLVEVEKAAGSAAIACFLLRPTCVVRSPRTTAW